MPGPGATDPKTDLQEYLRVARETMLWKLDGLSEYDVRRPLTPTATNLLGLLRHLTAVEAGYLGAVFARPYDGPVPTDGLDAALPLDAVGRVPHWPADRAAITLHRVLVHVVAETHRHAGHADILRETVDGAVGHRSEVDNMAEETDWARHHARVEAAARAAGDGPTA